MNRHFSRKASVTILTRLFLSGLSIASMPAWALPGNAQAKPFQTDTDNGVILIDQSRALAGDVTPGDEAGFPVTITESGSYRLSGNLKVPDTNTTVIKITTTESVTVDLNGFMILGPTVCTTDSSGMVESCSPTGLGRGIEGGSVVMNGTIKGMGDAGVRPSGEAVRIDNVTATNNGRTGIECIAVNCIVSHSNASFV